ncbi:unnamed protein product [Urochloa decumbens]|uniref:Uncharacterized protein n=1 Tax=Urochloa decumbens TaxID=240449 RepID=A0ABC8ZIX8_9POAL
MDPSEKQGSQQKKSRKALPTSRRSTGAHATASVSGVVPPGGLGVASGAFGGGSGTVAPSSGGGTNSPQAGSGLWTGSSSEWLYPPGGFVNSLQMPYPYVNFPNGNQLPENSHFVGGPSTRGTPSPNGIGLAMDGTDAHETIHIDGDETLEPGRTDRRLNWSHEEDVRLASACAMQANVVNVEDSPKERPIGHKKAKDERNGKRKSPEAISAIGEKLDKFIEASNKAEKITEVQQSLADKKLEVAKLNHKAAQEQTKGKMLDLYRDLLCGSTSGLSEQALAERSKALEDMRLALFAKEN